MNIEELRRQLERPNTTSVLETIDVHSGERTTLRHFDCVIEAPNWTSDGQRRLVTHEGPSYLHGWSPDGKRLAYCAQRHDSYDIYTIDRSGGHEERLTSTPGLDDGPEYSPDGRYIWFNSTRSGLMQIWRMNVNGEEQQQVLHEDANCWFPHVSPDGKWIAYIAYAKGDVEPMDHPPNRHVELRIASTEGGPSRLLAKLFGGQGTMNVNSWSPDSTQLALVSYRTKA